MYRCVVACAVALLISAGPALSPALSAGPSCKEAVANAFAKQRGSKAFTMKAQMSGESGPVELTVEYLPPDRMHQTIMAAGQEPLETTLVGTRAWSRQGGAWEELMPGIAQTVIAQVHEAVVEPPKDVGEFECVDKATVEGKEYLAYRSVEPPGATAKGAGGSPVHRTVYVDPQSGLPALNIVAEEQAGAQPLFKGVYAYPADLVIEPQLAAPLAKIR